MACQQTERFPVERYRREQRRRSLCRPRRFGSRNQPVTRRAEWDQPNREREIGSPVPLYAISRLRSPGGFWYWSVAFCRRGKAYFKSFYDVRRGGSDQSLAAAIAWRDEQLVRLDVLGKRDFCQLRRTTNTSGVPGVQFIRPRNQPDGSWQARHKLPDGRVRTKTFAVQKYGEWEAFRLAAEARREMLEAVENTPYLHHPLAKEIRERQRAERAIEAKNLSVNNI